MSAFFYIFALVAILLYFGGLYIWYILRHSGGKSEFGDRKLKTVRPCIIMGSGGHTTEMCNIVKHLSPAYSNPLYVIAETDALSAAKVEELMVARGEYSIVRIPRSREVGQSFLKAIVPTISAILVSIKIIWNERPDLILTNGPGTCVPVCIASAFFDMLRLRNTTIVYVESICRVNRLSMSGALFYFSGLADDIIVMWPELKENYPRSLLIHAIQ